MLLYLSSKIKFMEFLCELQSSHESRHPHTALAVFADLLGYHLPCSFVNIFGFNYYHIKLAEWKSNKRHHLNCNIASNYCVSFFLDKIMSTSVLGASCFMTTGLVTVAACWVKEKLWIGMFSNSASRRQQLISIELAGKESILIISQIFAPVLMRF